MPPAVSVNLSPKLGRAFVINQSKYEHLNAFNALTDRNVVIDRTRPVGRTGYSGGQRPIAVKNNICTTEFKTTAASGILQNFKSPYEATVVTQLRQMRTVFVAGTTNMDEFGMGSHSTHSHHGPVKMQRYPEEDSSAGGSSGGSAMAVASAQCWAALGTDTGGSVRLPAAYTGVVGFKPSYGLISRRGVIAYANSLDTVGILGRTARDIESIFDSLNVHDPLDPTSVSHATRKRLKVNKAFKKNGRRSLKIGIPVDYNIATLHPMARKAWIHALKLLSQQGHTLHPVRLPSTQHALSAYYIIAPAEASSNLAKYDGVRYGSRAEGTDGTPDSVLFAKSRGQGFGPEVQRRILLGAFSLSAQAIDNYFIQAQKVRRLIQQEFDGVFAKPNPLLSDQTSNKEGEKVDVLLCPTAPSPAPSTSDVNQQSHIQAYMNDVFTVPSSLAGLPAISVPINFYPDLQEIRTVARSDKFVDSVGIQIIGQYADDKLVLDLADQLQYLVNPPQLHAGYDMTAWGGSFLGTASKMDHARFANIATKLGVSLSEAAAHDAKYRKQRLPAVKDLLQRNRGREHIEKMARLCNTTPDGYVNKFLQKKRPLDAERNYSEDLLKETAGIDPQMYAQNSKLLFEAVGGDRIREAATLYGLAPRKYIAKFVTEADPVAAEAASYEKMLARKGMLRQNKGAQDSQPEQKQEEPLEKPESEDFTISKIRTYEVPDMKFKILKVDPKKGEPLVRRVEFDSGMKPREST